MNVSGLSYVLVDKYIVGSKLIEKKNCYTCKLFKTTVDHFQTNTNKKKIDKIRKNELDFRNI